MSAYPNYDDHAEHARVWNANSSTPFRFGPHKTDPESWGPTYDIKRKRNQSVSEAIREANERWWRRDPTFASNSASGQAGEFNAKKYRASMATAFQAQCAKDKREWATGQAIAAAYEAVMAAKRARLAAMPILKPRYVLRDGVPVLLAA